MVQMALNAMEKKVEVADVIKMVSCSYPSTKNVPIGSSFSLSCLLLHLIAVKLSLVPFKHNRSIFYEGIGT